ncbi:hypothetical protein ACIA8O_23020 [Kitasatospora sp. NPDC051853]|uniref:hypothetical protein n=1 Tax=Kitasatospora sp. NPDC051853 TaxID=3364058 RepID=UPI0037970933
MTTAGSDGASEDRTAEDPFAYLYRPADGESAAEQPRDAKYSRPVEVGRAQYPPPQPQAVYQQTTQHLPHQQGAHPQGQQHARYAEHSRPQPGEQAPPGRSKGVVIGAIAVVAAIAIGAGVALSMGDAGKGTKTASGTTGSAAATTPGASPSPSPTPSTTASPLVNGTGVADFSGLQLSGGAAVAGSVGGAKGKGGYVTGLAGSAVVSWKVTVPQAATYRVSIRFNNTGADAQAVVKVDGKPTYTPINLRNYKAGLQPEQAWFGSWISAEIPSAGEHTITIESLPSSPAGAVLFDQIAVTPNGVDPGL